MGFLMAQQMEVGVKMELDKIGVSYEQVDPYEAIDWFDDNLTTTKLMFCGDGSASGGGNQFRMNGYINEL